MTATLTIARPDDWHVHLRDGAGMATAVHHTSATFARAIVMPNLQPPVVTVDQAAAYCARIVAALPPGSDFQPLMTLYLTDDTPPAEVGRAVGSGLVVGAKLYPAGATTNSSMGVTRLDRVDAVLEAMERLGLPLLVHGEVTDPEVDIFDRERVFIERVLAPLVERWSGLKVVLEHVTTRDGVDFVASSAARVAATVTPQHLLLDRNHLLAGGVRPHHYCLPVLKSSEHRRAVVGAATGSDRSFFLGTDSAPHPRRSKEGPCAAAGIYSAHGALGLYAEAFEAAGALDRLEDFASLRGADYYGLPRNAGTVTLVREPWNVPDHYPFGDDVVVPLRAGSQIQWKLES
jgi:dihydroorotase